MSKNIKPGGFKMKFGSIVEKQGFTQVPNILIRERKALKISRVELELILNFMSYEFNGTSSYPSLLKLARHNGTTETTIHKAKTSLETKGYIQRIGVSPFGTVVFSLGGIKRRIEAIAEIKLDKQCIDRDISEEEYNDIHRRARDEKLFNSNSP